MPTIKSKEAFKEWSLQDGGENPGIFTIGDRVVQNNKGINSVLVDELTVRT